MGQGEPSHGTWGSGISQRVAWEKLVLLLPPVNLSGTARDPQYNSTSCLSRCNPQGLQCAEVPLTAEGANPCDTEETSLATERK